MQKIVFLCVFKKVLKMRFQYFSLGPAITRGWAVRLICEAAAMGGDV